MNALPVILDVYSADFVAVLYWRFKRVEEQLALFGPGPVNVDFVDGPTGRNELNAAGIRMMERSLAAAYDDWRDAVRANQARSATRQEARNG